MKKTIIITVIILLLPTIVLADGSPLYTFIISSGNEGEYSGIYNYDQFWFITFAHGDDKGNTYLEIDGYKLFVPVEDMRDIISWYLGVDIPEDDYLIMQICFPQQVKNKNEEALEANNVMIMGDWYIYTCTAYSLDENRIKFYIYEWNTSNCGVDDDVEKYLLFEGRLE